MSVFWGVVAAIALSIAIIAYSFYFCTKGPSQLFERLLATRADKRRRLEDERAQLEEEQRAAEAEVDNILKKVDL